MLISRIEKTLKASRLGQGFTMVEVMVAVFLLLVAMAGIVPFFVTGLTQASTVRYKSIATNLARERMEEIRQLDYREISTDSLIERFGTSAAYQRSATEIVFEIAYAVEEATYDSGTLKKVTVTVGWTAPPRTSAASITTLIHQQFLGPRGSLLEVTPSSSDPLGTPFPLLNGTTKARYHIAQADWDLVLDNLDQAGMSARDVYMRLVLFDDQGQSISLGNPDDEFRIGKSYLRYATDAGGKVNDIWFEYNFDAHLIPDGYWELRATAYNQFDQPGNVWRIRVRVENGAPSAPAPFQAAAEGDEKIILMWYGGQERDRAYYVLERRRWDGAAGMWPESWVTLESSLDPRAVTFTDTGSVDGMLDPWGSAGTQNHYQYRLWAVDRCAPGLAGPAAFVEVVLPASATTTTTVAGSTTTTSGGTTTTAAATTTTTALNTVYVNNTVNKTYSLLVKNQENETVYSGSVGKRATRAIADLPAGNYQLHASSPGRPTITQSFSLPGQSGQTVLTIL